MTCRAASNRRPPCIDGGAGNGGAHTPLLDDGAAKYAIRDFVAHVTKEGGEEFVPPAERIANFDNDGTLWCEQPSPLQA